MKTIETILEHIISKPEFKPLQKHICYRNFTKILTPRIRKGIEFIYLRDDTLFIAISHPAHKFHIDSNIDSLKSILKQFVKYQNQCSWMEVTQIKTFITKLMIKEKRVRKQSDPKYTEPSRASFNIFTEDDEIRRGFEEIRKSIIKTKNLQSKGIF